MKKYDLLVIGFGKAGKTLAGKMSSLGKKVALVEKDSSMYGGTCINIGCIPTKTLIKAAEKNMNFAEAMAQKELVTTRLRHKNETVLTAAGVDLYNATAQFLSNQVVEISAGSDVKHLRADIIVINTGARSAVLPIPGLLETKNVVDSTGIQNLKQQPERLGLIGGGNIGLEFASLYSRLGSQVTVFESGDTIFPREEPIAAKLAQSYLEEDGVSFKLGARVEGVRNDADNKVILTANGHDYVFDTVMYATGRKPNTEGLGLENTDIALTEDGAIQVDDYCQTSVPNIYAVGDVNGGLQFTYTSLDDFRLVFGKLTGQGHYKRSDRKNVPRTTFIEPPLSSVGMIESEVIAAGFPYQVNELAVANMPRAHVNNDLRGIFKVLVNSQTKEILGATIFSADSQEIINMIKMAIDNHIPYTYLKNQIFTHPSLSENLNDVFAF
ncbi:FAD-containing oxidoreductase [Streptococcus macacae]|uniref:Pyridine nucleotide-disulfide oxidoreductase n=1 Tax=Streptococcus macacae NCTC 11558 TaxID=764298 RepID=G5JX71_9STRE|nr:FAD-containing oxidoreductase [Streptococcus macacae]EHJ52353.1 pyridine nucleotide-disulfide oxidoreductase [Streptococcus macacae NCTC 11558]SUN77844.1 putative pyridine nucleotide-disulfide oxidoreductase YkgC [Streptococcus macacae NCTC 11558]